MFPSFIKTSAFCKNNSSVFKIITYSDGVFAKFEVKPIIITCSKNKYFSFIEIYVKFPDLRVLKEGVQIILKTNFISSENNSVISVKQNKYFNISAKVIIRHFQIYTTVVILLKKTF